MKHITIIGCGLIGGSFAALVKKFHPQIKICGIGRRKEPLETAIKQNIIDSYELSVKDYSFASTDLIIISSPISTVLPTIEMLTKKIKEKQTIVDFSSVKTFLNHETVKRSHHSIIAAHPMGGLDVQGLENANASVLESCPMVMFNQGQTVETFFKELKFQIIPCESYEMHDEWMCNISHGPYVIASLLPSILSEKNSNELNDLAKVSAGGFRDTTRICNSPVEWGVDVIEGNKSNMINLIDNISNQLNNIKTLIKESKMDELKKLLQNAKNTRKNIVKK